MFLVHPGSQGWKESQGEMASRVYLASKENLPKQASRVSVDQTGTLVLLGPRERGVLLVCQASVNQESLERRGVRGDQAFLDHLEYLV